MFINFEPVGKVFKIVVREFCSQSMSNAVVGLALVVLCQGLGKSTCVLCDIFNDPVKFEI